MAKVLTYNLWHGLSPEGLLRFREMEPKSRRLLRQQLQLEVLQHNPCNVYFLQEVNPVEQRSEVLARELDLQPVYCRDNSGLKIGNVGAPFNLDSGLGILLSKSEYIESTKVLRLSSDGKTLLKPKLSFQLSESRSALMVSTINDESGSTLWVNTHLHHGIEMNDSVILQIQQLKQNELISEGVEQELLERLRAADIRRAKEVQTLIDYLDSVKHRYNLIVLAGDLNATPDSSALNMLYNFGFENLNDPTGTQELATWDPESNTANHILSYDFIPALVLEDLSFDKKTIQNLHELARGWEHQPRKIDYILTWSDTGAIEVETVRLEGKANAEGFAPSDHYALFSEFQWKPN